MFCRQIATATTVIGSVQLVMDVAIMYVGVHGVILYLTDFLDGHLKPSNNVSKVHPEIDHALSCRDCWFCLHDLGGRWF